MNREWRLFLALLFLAALALGFWGLAVYSWLHGWDKSTAVWGLLGAGVISGMAEVLNQR